MDDFAVCYVETGLYAFEQTPAETDFDRGFVAALLMAHCYGMENDHDDGSDDSLYRQLDPERYPEAALVRHRW